MDVAIAVSFKNVLYLRKKRRMDQAEVSGPDSACKGEEPNSSEQEAVSRDCKGTTLQACRLDRIWGVGGWGGWGRKQTEEETHWPQILFLLNSVASHFSKEFPSLVLILCLNAKLNNPPAPQSCHFRPGGAGVLGKAAELPSTPPTPSWGTLIWLPEWGWLLSSPPPLPPGKARPCLDF